MMYFAKIDGSPTWKQDSKTLARFIPLFQTHIAAEEYASHIALPNEVITTHPVDVSKYGG